MERSHPEAASPEHAEPPPPRRRRGAIPAIVVALALLHLAPIWGFAYFPTQDGPPHLHNARVILEYHRPERTTYREYYALNLRPIPNLVGHLALAAAMAAVPPRMAEKIVLSLILLVTLASVFYALNALRPGPSFAWLLPFPILYNFPLHMGFYNFALSVAISIFAVGYVLPRRARFGVRESLALASLLLLLYISHLLAWIFALITIAIVTAWRLHLAAATDPIRVPQTIAGADASGAADPRNGAHPPGGTQRIGGVDPPGGVAPPNAADPPGEPYRALPLRPLRRVLAAPPFVPLAAAVPAMAAFAVFRTGPAPLSPASAGPATLVRLRHFWGIDALLSYSPLETLPAVATAVLLAGTGLGLAVAGRGRRPPSSACVGVGWAAVAFAILYFFAPNGAAGGGYILPRVALYTLILTILWIGGHRLPAPIERLTGAAAVVLALWFLAVRTPTYAEFERQLAGLAAAAAPIAENSTLLGLSFAPYGLSPDGGAASMRVKPLLHAAALVAAEKHLVLLDNYEAAHPGFPVRYRPDRDPTPHLARAYYPNGARLAIASYEQRTGGRVDYVLAWGIPATRPSSQPTLAHLDSTALRIPTPGSPLARLYRPHPSTR
ncbi:MAG TPA: hypothetical protein VF158_13465 [Longimicrobiales bacterium]